MTGASIKPCPKGTWFHDWLTKVTQRVVTEPKRGPYDPRSDADHTHWHKFDICVQCGKERETDSW